MKVNGKDTANYIMNFDTRYFDENGMLQNSTVPEWRFNRDAIKEKNIRFIDGAAANIASKLPEKQSASVLEFAENLKSKSLNATDVGAAKIERWLNGITEADPQAMLNKGLIKKIGDKLSEIPETKLLKGGKAVAVVGDIIDVADFGYTLVKDYQADGVIGYETVKKAVGIGGAAAGAAVGAKVGAWLGAVIGGAVSGGVLAAPVAALGGLVGGWIGDRLGEKLGEKLMEENRELFHE